MYVGEKIRGGGQGRYDPYLSTCAPAACITMYLPYEGRGLGRKVLESTCGALGK